MPFSSVAPLNTSRVLTLVRLKIFQLTLASMMKLVLVGSAPFRPAVPISLTVSMKSVSTRLPPALRLFAVVVTKQDLRKPSNSRNTSVLPGVPPM